MTLTHHSTTAPRMTSVPKVSSQAPSSLVADEVLFRSLFEDSGLGMASLGTDLAIRDANLDFSRIFDRRPDGVIGRNFFELLHPGTHPVLRWHFERLTDGRRTSFTDRMVAMRPCATVFTGEMTGVAVRQGAQRAAAVIVLVRRDRAAAPSGASADTLVARGRLLTEIDARVLEGIARGMTTVQLAARLYLSRQGVEYHVTTLLRRLNAPNRAALVSRAYAAGVLGLGSWPPQVLPDAIRPSHSAA